MQDMEKSRQEWEQELRYLQQNITPEQELRNAPLIAKRIAGTGISDFAHLMRFVAGGALLALGIAAFSFHIPYNSVFAVVALLSGCHLGAAAFRRKPKNQVRGR